MMPFGMPYEPDPHAYHHVLEEHRHTVCHDPTDNWVTLATRAVITDSGGSVEIGDHSMSPGEAWAFAQSLLILAELADPTFRSEPTMDRVDVDRWLRSALNDESGAE